MAPQILLAQEAEELHALGLKIRQWQEAQKHSDSEMLRRFGSLGSTKTYQRVRERQLDELDLERQLANYRAVWALIEAIGDRNAAEDQEIYDDLTPAVHLRRAFLDILAERGNARFVLMEGDTGTGKSCSLTALLHQFGQRILPIEACDAWDDSPMALLGAILAAKGVAADSQPGSTVGRLEMVVRKLNEGRVCLATDEGHHLGPHQLNTIKTLINRTAGEFVILAMPTLWKRTERAAWEEVRQLTGNRLAERVKIGGLNDKDVRKVMERRCNFADPKFIEQLTVAAPKYGNLAFVRDVAKRIRTAAADQGKPTLEQAVAAVQAEIASR